MTGITTHVLDTAAGRPAAGVAVRLERRVAESWQVQGAGTTDAGGRIARLLPEGEVLRAGSYRLTFETGSYFAAQGVHAFHPAVDVQFEVEAGRQHCHVPLLVAPYGYSTYRGS